MRFPSSKQHTRRRWLTVSAGRWLAAAVVLAVLAWAVPANTAGPQGTLQIHGTARVGVELRADASGLTDADGGVAAVIYHWRHAVARRIRGRLFLRMCEGAGCANLATGETYLLTSSDRDKYVGVQATVIDGEGNRHYVGRTLRPKVRDGGVSASESILQVSEGESGTYEVALRSQPADTVTVNITGHEGTDASVNPASLAFTVDDWSTTRTVTVGVATDNDTVSDAAVVLVHQPSGGGFDGMGGDLVTVLPGEEQGTLTATFSNVPAWHASEGFTFRVSFSHEVTVTEAVMRDEVFAVTGGSVSSADRAAPPSNATWEVEVLPASSADVSVLLPATSGCAATGAVCTSGGLKLAAGESLAVPQEWKVGDVSAFAGNGDVQVSWSLLDGSASYKVQWKSGNQTFSEAAADGRELTTPGTSTQAAVVGLTSGTIYTFRVIGVSTDGTQSMPSDTDWSSPWPTEPLTATPDLPATHDGSTVFEGRVVFSESVLVANGMARDSFQIGNGRLVTIDSSNASAWDFEIEPSGTGAVSIFVPAHRSCAQTGAICTADWRRLSTELSASVTGPPQGQQALAPLVASFASVPAEHDGETEFWLELSFDAAVEQGSKRHIRALLGATEGTVTRLRRKDDRLDHWRVRVEPSSHEAVTVTLSPACGETGAVCTPDGRTFTAALAQTIPGPATPRHLIGTAPADTLSGQDGADTLEGGLGADTPDGEGGDDVLYGDAGDDELYGGADNDELYGDADDDELYGESGDDDLYGGGGDDVLDGGGGADILTGGSGADTFVFAAGHGTDTITDFTPAEVDLIDLRALSGITGFAALTLTADDADTLLDLSAHGGGTVRLEDIAAADLAAEDFLLPSP